MPRGVGPSLGAAVMNLLGTDVVQAPARSAARMLSYVLGKTTGASKESVMRQVGVSESTLRRWLSGKQRPSKRSEAQLRAVYGRFWEINHRRPHVPRGLQNVALRITNTTDPDGIVFHDTPNQSRVSNPVLAGRGRHDWAPVMRATTPGEAEDMFTYWVIENTNLPDVPEYLEFLTGAYVIQTV